MRMKPLAIVLGCAVALVGGYKVATRMHFLKPVDWLVLVHLKKVDRLFHGVKVNTAVEDRSDPYWQKAYSEVNLRPELLAYKKSADNYPGRMERGSTQLREIALTFDDGPHLPTAHALVEELKSLNLRATFFVVGKMAEQHPEIIREEAAAGNEIANHSFSHVNLSRIPAKEVFTEYLACNILLKKILGYQPRFCRPPGGNSDPAVYQAAEANGLSTVLWTNDPSDYANPGEDVILDRTLKHLSNGGILLLHEGVRQTMSVLPLITKEIRDRGYKIVTVGQLVRDSEQTHPTTVAQLSRRLIVQPARPLSVSDSPN